MTATFIRKLFSRFADENHRGLTIRKNIFYSFGLKVLSALTGFALVRVTLGYVNTSEYGLWVTIASLVAWINAFDIGLGNGLRNKVALALAENNIADIRKYIATTYAILFLLSLAVFSVVLLAGCWLDWNALLGIPRTFGWSVWICVILTAGIFCVQFVLQPINSILSGMHMAFGANAIQLAGQVLGLVSVCILCLFTHPNLYFLIAAAAGGPLVVFIFATAFLFSTSLRKYAPSFGHIDRSAVHSLMSVSGSFFVIQIGALVLYETDTIVIARVLGTDDVTTFTVVFRYFSLLTLAFHVVLTPYWSAITEALATNDTAWVRRSLTMLRIICGLTVIAALCLWVVSGPVYRVWLGGQVSIPGSLTASMALYTMVQNWMLVHAYVLNGAGKLRLQLILVIITSIVNIPLSVFLIHQIGISGTVAANTAIMAFMSIFLKRQCELILAGKAHGIWNK